MNLLNIGTVVLVVLLIFDFEDSCINTSFLLDYEDVAKYKKRFMLFQHIGRVRPLVSKCKKELVSIPLPSNPMQVVLTRIFSLRMWKAR